jgi:hypothetical protein
MAEDGAGSAVRIDFFDDPPIEDRGVSASFLKRLTEQHGLHGRRDCRFEVHHRHSCGWCGACSAPNGPLRCSHVMSVFVSP